MEPIDSPGGTASRRHRAAWLWHHRAALAIGAAFATVVGTTGFVSYTHISALTMELHQSWKTAHLTPVFIDGQILIGSVYFLVTTGWQRWWGLVGVIPGLAESLFANYQSGIVHGREEAIWAMVCSQVFAGSSFLFERWLKAQAAANGTVPVRTVTVGCGHGIAADRDGQILDAWHHIQDCLGGKPSYRGLALMFGAHNETVRQLVMAADGTDPAGSERGPDPVLNGSAHAQP